MPRRLAALAVPLALAALMLSGCKPDNAAVSAGTDADPVVEAAPAEQPAPAAQPEHPTVPGPKEAPVQPPQPGAAQPGTAQPGTTRPGDALNVEVFAYQVSGLAEEGADAAAAKSVVLLVARGKHRSGGWTSEIVELPMRIFPPQFELRTTPPPEGSMNTMALVPFTSAAWVRMDQAVPALKVRVNGELRDIKVEPAGKIKNAMPAGR